MAIRIYVLINNIMMRFHLLVSFAFIHAKVVKENSIISVLVVNLAVDLMIEV